MIPVPSDAMTNSKARRCNRTPPPDENKGPSSEVEVGPFFRRGPWGTLGFVTWV